MFDGLNREGTQVAAQAHDYRKYVGEGSSKAAQAGDYHKYLGEDGCSAAA